MKPSILPVPSRPAAWHWRSPGRRNWACGAWRFPRRATPVVPLAYAARAGLEAYVFMPRDVPQAFITECHLNGAHVELVDGLITDAGKRVAAGRDEHGWFDLSTLKEPYRVEGKKTMGYEIAEQLDWKLPNVIIYPTGGGTGLIGMWKSFDEMEALGWLDSYRPRLVAVQAAGCAPIVRAFERGDTRAEPWQNATTMAAGLRVPSAIGDALMLRALRDSEGTAVTVSEERSSAAYDNWGDMKGYSPVRKGAPPWQACANSSTQGWVDREERVVLFNTGSGLKYLDVLPESGCMR